MDELLHIQDRFYRMSNIASFIADVLKKNNVKIAIAELCTGGLISAMINQIPKSSEILERTIITCSDQTIIKLLEIDKSIIQKNTLISREATIAIARGIAKSAKVDIALAVVGELNDYSKIYLDQEAFIALFFKGEVHCLKYYFFGSRIEIIFSITEKSLEYVLGIISEHFNIIN
ncbi:CinA family protein [Lyticum sinuosum]|uniref:CinA superfamily protein n=1 Tax=Lyticum sinuosum TaxID=1332059 RepID=A0AAE4VLR6_9RICK|nr:CinA family protein [Lyticum sinuosum]MDZ5761617.1 CinA superfamily protein [Lyticum sinuosum]